MRNAYVTVPGRLEYEAAVSWQRQLRDLRHRDRVPDLLILTEHPPTYTCGRGTRPEHLLADETTYRERGFQLVEVERGGSATYHGPGQLVGYPIVDLRLIGRDVHQYIRNLEEVIIRVLHDHGLVAATRSGLTGVWCDDLKIAAIGIHVRHWITTHGFALNVCPNLQHFQGIVPCGLSSDRVTSMVNLSSGDCGIWDLVHPVIRHFGDLFGLHLEPLAWSELTAMAQSDDPAGCWNRPNLVS